MHSIGAMYFGIAAGDLNNVRDVSELSESPALAHYLDSVTLSSVLNDWNYFPHGMNLC